MSNPPDTHPPADVLRDFIQGNLPASDCQAIEAHLADCDHCCETLAGQPDGTLLEIAREVATTSLRKSKTSDDEIPAPLRDHPRYRILGKVGTGGMGVVYKAEHRLMERIVALKVVHPWMLQNPDAVKRFHREVRVAARLTHPNIVAAYDADDAGDVHFLIMEFVAGVSLDRKINAGQQVSVPHACDWIRQAALGLQYAQEQGMVHRDIKPQNLMLTNDGVVKILDFGLMRMAADSDAATMPTEGTRAGMILGTPDYIAPEQIADSRSADIRADIYSLGCTFYQLLSGKPPIPEGTVIEKLHAHGSTGIPPLVAEDIRLPAGSSPQICEEIARIVAKMTAKNPSDRFEKPEQVAKALAKVLSSLRASAAPDKRTKPQAAESSKNIPEVITPSIGIIRPVVDKSPIRPKKSSPPRALPVWNSPLAMTGGGVLLALVVLAALWQSGWIFSNSAEPPVRGNSSQQPVVAANASAPRILMLLPSKGLWYPDYDQVRAALQAAGQDSTTAPQLVLAGPSLGTVKLAEDSPSGSVHADVLLNSQTSAADFDAIVLVGYDTSEFVPGGILSQETDRLLQDFQAQNKPIASLCAGQRIVLEHDFARNKQIAPCEYVQSAALVAGGARLGGQRVVQDGNLITGSTFEDANDVVKILLNSVNR